MKLPIEDFKRITSDYAYYSHLLKIRTKDDPPQIIPLIFNRPQRIYHKFKMDLRKLGVPVRIIILKNRQSGFTTYEQGESYMWCATKRYMQCLTMAHVDRATSDIFQMVNRFHERMDKNFKPDRKRDSSTKIEFPKRDCKFQIMTAGSASIGVTLNKAHLSEAAFYESLNNTLSMLKECIPNSGELVIESTPQGYNDFHTIYDGAQDLYHPRPKSSIKNGYYRFFTRWFDDPQYQFSYWKNEPIKTWDDLTRLTGDFTKDEKDFLKLFKNITPMQMCWRRWKIGESQGDMDKFWEQYPEDDIQCFLLSGSQFFTIKDVMMQMIGWANLHEPIETITELGLKIWEHPKPGLKYCAGGDPAEGKEGDDSAFHMVEERSGRTVMTFACNTLTPRDFAILCEKYCSQYNRAFLTIERNNHGHTVLNELIHHLDYYNPWELYHHHNYFEDFKPVKQQLMKEFNNAYEPGFPTKSNTKAMLLDNLNEFIREYPEAVMDIEVINQYKTFVRQGVSGKIGALSPNHDDRVIAHALAIWGRYNNKGPDDFQQHYRTF